MAGPLTRKVLLIGWDAADWKVASELIDAGRMPNLQRIVEDGVMGNLSTLSPVLSPMLWTSIATGKRAHKHGIHGFAEPDTNTGTVRPITNLNRKTKALWNILNQQGMRSNVVGWWPSHPTEPINGVMVSNHFQEAPQHRKDSQWPMRPHTVHPAEYAQKLAKFRVHPREIEGDQLLPFIPRAAAIDLKKDSRVAGVAKILAETASVQAVATAVMQHEPWDFMAIYFDGIDHFCHGFMKYRAPREEWISEEDFELYRDVVDTAYEFHDVMLGAQMALAGPDTTIIIVSDHGFHPDHLRPREIPNEPAGAADEHRPFGIVAMHGPGIKRDELVFGANLLDVTPTILTLLGLPVGRDMDGKPLVAAFDTNVTVDYIDSWDEVPGDSGEHPANTQVDPVDAQEALKQLVELGYIDRPDEDQEVAVRKTIKELRHNLARDYLDAHLFPQAIREFSALWDEAPDEGRFGVKLIECHLSLGRTKDARAAFERLVSEKQRYAAEARAELERLAEAWKDRKPEDITQDEQRELTQTRRRALFNRPAFAYLQGQILHAEKKHEEALEAFAQAADVQVHNRPSLYQAMGDCLLQLRRWDDAEQRFLKMLEIDPISPHPHVGLARCHLGRRRPKKALEEATAAVGLLYHYPAAHFLCGKALRGLRRPEEAIRAFEVAVAQNPVYPEAHRQLAELYGRQGNRAKVAEHQKLVVAARDRIRHFRSGASLPEDTDLAIDVALEESTSLGNMGDHLGEQISPETLAETTVIVSGLPRSGTSMMMQMLAAGGLPVMSDGVREADANNPRGYFELEAASKVGKDNSWLGESGGKGVKIVAQLLPRLPRGRQYRVIFMERPLGEITASQSAMLADMNKDGASLSERQLARTYVRQVENVQGVLSGHGESVSVLGVNYHEALSDPVRTARLVNRFCGGQLDEEAMAAAVEPQLRRQRIA